MGESCGAHHLFLSNLRGRRRRACRIVGTSFNCVHLTPDTFDRVANGAVEHLRVHVDRRVHVLGRGGGFSIGNKAFGSFDHTNCGDCLMSQNLLTRQRYRRLRRDDWNIMNFNPASPVKEDKAKTQKIRQAGQ